jgi:hypothetical protein
MWRTVPCRLCVTSVMSVFCVHLLMYQQLQQLEFQQLLVRRYGMSWQTVRPSHPSQFKTIARPPPLSPAKLVRMASWVVSLRPSALWLTHTAMCWYYVVFKVRLPSPCVRLMGGGGGHPLAWPQYMMKIDTGWLFSVTENALQFSKFCSHDSESDSPLERITKNLRIL